MLDAEHDSVSFGRFMVFEMEDLLALKEQAAVPVLLYLFRRFEKSLDGTPSLLMLDEAWTMLGKSAFRDKIHGWLRLLRSKNCAVIMATQSLSDAIRSGIMDVLIESCPTKIFLPNEEAGVTGTAGESGAERLLSGARAQRDAGRDHPHRDEEAALLPGVARRPPAVRSRARPRHARLRGRDLARRHRAHPRSGARPRPPMALRLAGRKGSGL